MSNLRRLTLVVMTLGVLLMPIGVRSQSDFQQDPGASSGPVFLGLMGCAGAGDGDKEVPIDPKTPDPTEPLPDPTDPEEPGEPQPGQEPTHTCCIGDWANCTDGIRGPCPEDQFRDDPDPAGCMTSITQGPSETREHTYERRARCMLDGGGLPQLPGVQQVAWAYEVSPQGSDLADSLTAPITITVGDNTSNVLAFLPLFSWAIDGYASGSSLLPIADIELVGTFDVSPWDAGSGYSRIRPTTFEVRFPNVEIHGVAMGQTSVVLETSDPEPTAATGLLDPQNGKFHMFLPVRFVNAELPGGSLGGMWASLYGSAGGGSLAFEGFQFRQPGRDATHAVGRHFASKARAIAATLPVGAFRSESTRDQYLAAHDSFIQALDSIGNDWAQLMGVGAQVDQHIAPLVDGPLGGNTEDDVMAQFPAGSPADRGVAYMTGYILRWYFEQYYPPGAE